MINNCKRIILNPEIYSLEAIYTACYSFVDRAYIFLDGNPKNKIIVSIKGKKNLPKEQLGLLSGEFQNELLYSALREKVSKRNKKIREYIVGRALYSIPLLEEFSKTGNYREDPLGIAMPWRKKYGSLKRNKNKKKTC